MASNDRPFEGLASTYAAFRPSYPGAAIDAILAGLPSPVVAIDLGAGTGISARLLARRGARVIAVEPDQGMLAEARRSSAPAELAAIDFRLASAESTGLAAGVAGVVLAAQSFHWFDRERALAECHRLLAPGGRLALLWNVKDESDPCAAAVGAVARRAAEAVRSAGRAAPPERSLDLGDHPLFRLALRTSFDNPERYDREGLFGRLRSTSYFPRQGPLQDELEAELGRIFTAHAEDGSLVLAQRAELTIFTRL